MSGFGYYRASKEIVVFVEGGKDKVSNFQWKRFMYIGYEKSIFTSLHLLSRNKYILTMLDTSFDSKRFQVEDDSGYFCWRFNDGSSLRKRDHTNRRGRCFIWEFLEIESKDRVPFERGWTFFKVAGCVARCFGGLWTFLETRAPRYL